MKMGKWFLLPVDSEVWKTEETVRVFKKMFGVGNGQLIIFTLKDGFFHNYIPADYFEKLSACIKRINGRDYKKLEHLLKTFYAFRLKFRSAIAGAGVKDYTNLSTTALIARYRYNRSWVHRATVYDQFGWLAED
ncbi:MAG: hypothetical protein HY981_03855 [Candidatus Magasanikbacteria bacterium]|nr:hypothetical protein [Candidatus Magasanikbacteria bacterium]